MLIDFLNNQFIARCQYAERDIPKQAGFRWSGTRKAWITTSLEKALSLDADWTQRAIQHYDFLQEVRDMSTELSWRQDTDFEPPAPPGKEFMGYQKAGVEYALLRKDTLIADQPGLGKTIQAIGVLNADETIKSALFIVPASLKINWQREIDRWMTADLTWGIADATRIDWVPNGVIKSGKNKGKTKFRKVETRDYWPDADIVIINYDILPRFLDRIQGRVWDLLVCDEAHCLKSEESLRTLIILGGPDVPTKAERKAHTAKKKQAREAARAATDPAERERLFDIACEPDLRTVFYQPIECNRRVFLTGTPILSRPIELWPIVQAFDPDGLGADKEIFGMRYCEGYFDTSRGKNGSWNFTGSSNNEELGQLLRGRFMCRRLKRDVLPDLPPKRRVNILLDSPEIREMVAREDELAQALSMFEAIAKGATMDEAEACQGRQVQEYMMRLGYGAATVSEDFDPDSPKWRSLDLEYAVAVSGLEEPAVAIMFEELAQVRRELGLAKLSAVVPWVKEFLEGGNKLILFAYHSDVVKALAEQLADYNPAVIWGGVPPAKRQAQVDKFQENDTCRLFIGNIHAAGVGLTLTKAADVAFAEADWVPAMIEQCEDRACRIGQLAARIMVYFLVANGSLDARIAQASLEKEDNIKATIGG